jgi:polyisoprenyl-phosphate glycosyltransferase
MNRLSLIIPCYFNEKNIPITTKKLVELEISFNGKVELEYIFVDDGSKDDTYKLLNEFKNRKGDSVKIIKLSGNFGAYNAILAGMKYSTGDCNVVLSADLQDPPELIIKMFEYWEKGVKLVIANRSDRNDNFREKFFSLIYHKLIKKFSSLNIPNGGFDFCLFDNKLKLEVLNMTEKNTNTLFLFLWLKYDYVSIPYIRQKRELGESKWTFNKKVKLLIDSFISFSFVPIRIISILGVIVGITTFLYAVLLVYKKIVGEIELEGWTTLMVVFLLTSSFIMFALAILGEYLWRILDQVNGRPNYIIEKVV